MTKLPLFLLSILGILMAETHAAWITGNVRDTGLAPVATNITFTPLSTPMAVSPTVIISKVIQCNTDTNGNFGILLGKGDYRVTVASNAPDSFLISVPEGNTTNEWTGIATGVLHYQYPYSPAYLDKSLVALRGDLFGFDGTNAIRVAAGLHGQFLISDTSQAVGLRWAHLDEMLTPAKFAAVLGNPATNGITGWNNTSTGYETKSIVGRNNLEIVHSPGAISFVSPWVQSVVGTTNGYDNTAAQIPLDDTLPQSNEGKQIVAAGIRPLSTNHHLQIFYTGSVCALGATTVTAALFRNDETNAIAVVSEALSATAMKQIHLAARVSGSDTNMQTFKVRVGPSTATTLYFNGNTSTRLHGGLAEQKLFVCETAK